MRCAPCETQTITDEEMLGLLKDAVGAGGESTTLASGASFERASASVLEKHMRSYALECFGHGRPAHPPWLLQVPDPPHTCALSLASH